MHHRRASALLGIFLLIAGAATISSEPDSRNVEKVFTIGLGDQELTFNPLHAHTSTDVQILTALYEGLLTYHPLSLEPVPGAAYKWDISNDKTVYTFYLRENAQYSNGDPVTAEDFRSSFLKILNPKEGAEYSVYLDVIKGAKPFRDGKSTDPLTVGIRAVSEKVLEITLEKPASHFLKVLCLINFVPIHPSYKSTENWDQQSTFISNGPFTISKRTKEEIIFIKNKHYWDDESIKIDSISLSFYKDSKLLARDVNAGKIHWTTLQVCDYQTLDSTSREKIVPNPMFATSFLFFVCKEKPFNDPRVRRGLSLILPWKDIRSREYSLYPTSRLVPEIPKYPEVKGISEQDINSGLALLKEAGYPGGQGLPAISILITKGNTLYADILAKAWRENLKVEVKFKEVDSKDFFSEVEKHNYTISSYTWIADFADPLAFLQMWTSESNLNEALLNDPAYDALISDSLSVIGVERYTKLAKAEELLLQEGTILPIDHIAAFNLIDYEMISGWYPNPLDTHPLKYIEIKEGKLNKWIVRSSQPSSHRFFSPSVPPTDSPHRPRIPG